MFRSPIFHKALLVSAWTLFAKDLRVCPTVLSAALLFALAGVGPGLVIAQTSVPPNQVTKFKDTTMLKPPAGAKVAIIEWDDMECPYCAHAFPIVHQAVDHYKVPLMRYDFQIHNGWCSDAQLYARYMQDTLSPDLATEYRREVFASQSRISSKDDLHSLTQKFMASHGKPMPSVIDPTGQFKKEVDADRALGEKLGIRETPTILVVTKRHWIQVEDVKQLSTAIHRAEAEASVLPNAHPAVVTNKKHR